MSDGDYGSSKKRSGLAEAGKYLLLFGIVAAATWFLFGDRIRGGFETRDVVMNFKMTSKSGHAEEIGEIIRNEYWWKVYFKHLPEEQIDADKAVIMVRAEFNRKLDGGYIKPHASSNKYVPGTVTVELKVKDTVADTIVYSRNIRRKLPSFTLALGEDYDDTQEMAFGEAEEDILDELPIFLRAAALHAMSYRPEQANDYGPILVDGLKSVDTVVQKAASQALCRLGPAAKKQLGVLRKMRNTGDSEDNERGAYVNAAIKAIEGEGK